MAKFTLKPVNDDELQGLIPEAAPPKQKITLQPVSPDEVDSIEPLKTSMPNMAADLVSKIPRPDTLLTAPFRNLPKVSELGSRLEKQTSEEIIPEAQNFWEDFGTKPVKSDIERVARAGVGTVGSLLAPGIKMAPFTPEQAAEYEVGGRAMGKGAELAGEGFAKLFPKTAEFLTKTPASDAVKWAINRIKYELKIPQELGLGRVDLAAAIREGRITEAQAARMDDSIYQEALKKRVLPPEDLGQQSPSIPPIDESALPSPTLARSIETRTGGNPSFYLPGTGLNNGNMMMAQVTKSLSDSLNLTPQSITDSLSNSARSFQQVMAQGGTPEMAQIEANKEFWRGIPLSSSLKEVSPDVANLLKQGDIKASQDVLNAISGAHPNLSAIIEPLKAAQVVPEVPQVTPEGGQVGPGTGKITLEPVSAEEVNGVKPIESTRKKKINNYIANLFKRSVAESHGQGYLNEMAYNNISPSDVGVKFWTDVYPQLPEMAKEYFQKFITGQGFKPGSTIGIDKTGNPIVGKDWQELGVQLSKELGSKANYLEGEDRGWTVLMHQGNLKFPESLGKVTLEPVSAEEVGIKPKEAAFDKYYQPSNIPGELENTKFVRENLPQFEKFYMEAAKKELGSSAPNYVSADLAKTVDVPGRPKFQSEMSAPRHESGSAFAKSYYDELLANPETKKLPVLISGGISGAGKTSGIKSMGINTEEFAAIYDTNLNKLSTAKRIIDKALESNPERNVDVYYFDRDPVDAFKEGVYKRFKKYPEHRIVPIEAHISNMESRNVIEDAAKYYQDNPRVKFHFVDNNGLNGKAHEISIDKLNPPRYTKSEVRRILNGHIEERRQSSDLTERQALAFQGGDVERGEINHNVETSGGRSESAPVSGSSRGIEEKPATGEVSSPDSFGSPVHTEEINRIAVSPLPNKSPKSLNQISFDLSKALNQKIVTGKVGKWGGLYFPGSSALVTRFSGDLDTTAHEIGHRLDDLYGIVSEWNNPRERSPFDDELSKFWTHGSVANSGPRSNLSYKRAEGVAEFIRAMIVNPKQAQAAAPKFFKFLQNKLPSDVKKTLATFSEDVRTLAGATAHEKIMSNVNWEPKENTLFKDLTGKDAPPGFRLTWADKLQISLQDNLKAFTKAVDYAKGEKGLDEVLPAKDPIVLARLFNGMHAKMDDIFEKGMIDSENNRVTPGGIKWLVEPLDKTTMQTLTNDMQEVTSYMIAERTLEKAVQLLKSRVSGIGGGLESDVAVAKKRISELKENPEKFKVIQEAAKRYRQWSDSVLKYMVDKGRMSKESYDFIKKNNEYYVAMKRLMEVSPNEEIVAFRGMGGGKLGSVTETIKKFKGSTRQIENPYTSLMENTYKSVREADRTEVMRSFRDLLKGERQMHEGEPQDLANVGRIAKSGDPHTIPIFVDGKKEIWQFQPDVYKALKGIHEGQAILPGWMTVLARIQRMTITHMPQFAVRNIIRDTFERMVKTETGSKLFESFTPKTEKEKSGIALHGGLQSGNYMRDRVDYAKAMNKALIELTGDKDNLVVLPSRISDAYSRIMENSETRGRLAEYRSAYNLAKDKLGYDDYNAGLYAASHARGLMDFAIAGNLVRVINQIIPFTNASIQGVIRDFKGAKQNPKGMTARWALYILVPTLLERLYNAVNNNEEYNQLPAYRKDMFWNFKITKNHWMIIPKPFELGVLASGVSRAFDSAMGNTKAFDGYGGSTARAMLPIDESAIGGPFRGAIQVIANYDFFRNKYIVPPYEKKLDVNLRRTEKSTRLAKVLQSALGVDARNIDFIMREQFGYLGGFIASASDIGRQNKGLGLRDTGLAMESPAFNARDVQWVLQAAERRGLTGRPEYKTIKNLLSVYLNQTSSEMKDKTAAELRSVAEKVRNSWEPNIENMHKTKPSKMEFMKSLSKRERSLK